MLAKRLMWILWPSFLGACAMEMLVFALVDPSDIQWQGAVFEGRRQAFYTLSFFVFWGVVSAASALTCLLGRQESDTAVTPSQTLHSSHSPHSPPQLAGLPQD